MSVGAGSAGCRLISEHCLWLLCGGQASGEEADEVRATWTETERKECI